MRSKFFRGKYHKKGLKYGLMGTAAAAVASGNMAALAAPFGSKESSAYESAKVTAQVGLGLTGAFMLRKHLVRGAAAGAKAFSRSAKKSGKVMFRRIRGRIVPVRAKGYGG